MHTCSTGVDCDPPVQRDGVHKGISRPNKHLLTVSVPGDSRGERNRRRFPPKPPPQHKQLSFGASASVADLLTVDMNKHPELVADAVAPLLPLLKDGAYLIMTWKFFGIGRDKTSAMESFVQRLGGDTAVVNCRCVWLLSNTVHERTFVAQVAQRLAM